MGLCRISFKILRGLCGVDEYIIVGRNFVRMVVGGIVVYLDYVRDIVYILVLVDLNGNYKIRDEVKLIILVKEWDVEIEGRDIYDVVYEVVEIVLMEFGKFFGILRFIKNVLELR